MSIEEFESSRPPFFQFMREAVRGLDLTTSIGVAAVDLSLVAGITDNLVNSGTLDLGGKIVEYGVALPADAALAAFSAACLIHGTHLIRQKRRQLS
jgi:hypothetical protein